MLSKNSRQTYALHLMNSLLNKFCYLISNVSNRKNLHRVQLMTESYPDRQYYSKKQCLLRIQGAWHVCPNNLRQSSQDSENLSRMPKQSGACIQVDLKLFPNQHGTLSWVYDY